MQIPRMRQAHAIDDSTHAMRPPHGADSSYTYHALILFNTA